VAEALGLPFVYVRSSPKDHGRQNLIEGEIKAGQTVVVIEDLVSTGQSSLKAVAALRQAGCTVKGLLSVFSYGLKKADDNFRSAHCPFYSLSNYDVLLEKAVETKTVSPHQLEVLRQWRHDPEHWKA
jgi:orotate phosphoribosyltransferase